MNSNEGMKQMSEHMMKKIQVRDLDFYLRRYAHCFAEEEKAFSKFMRQQFREKSISQKDVFAKANIPTKYGYKLISEEKHTTQRDTILKICLSMHMNIDEIQLALVLCNLPALCMHVRRDVILLATINSKIYSIDEVNRYLTKYNEKQLID